MKKFFCWTLSLLMISTLFFVVSCSSQDEEVFDLVYNTDYEIDLTGQTYRWGSNWPEQIIFESGFSEGGDMVLKRLSDLKEKYGCTFEIIKWENDTALIFYEVAAGYDTTLNFIDSDIKVSGEPLYKAKLLYALDDIPNIDMSDNKFGTPRFLQDAILDGKYYGFVPYAWEYTPEYTGVIHFNEQMLSSLGLNSPHELRENGMWDWANFKEYLLSIQAAAENAGYEDNFIPLICGATYDRDAMGFMFANGLQMVEGSNGNYTFGVDNSNGMAAIEFLADLYNEGLYEQRGSAQFVKNKMSALMSNHSYFSTHYYQGGGNFLPAQDYVYGMIRYPHGPNGDENSVSAYVNKHRKSFILNASGHDIEDIGIVMNFVFAPLDDPKGWAGLLKEHIFYHDEDYNEFMYMIENVNYTYNVFLEKGFDTFASNINSAVVGEKSVSEVFDSTRSMIQEAIDKNVTWTFDELVG